MNLELAVKFENINCLEILDNKLKIKYFNELFTDIEIKKFKNIFKKNLDKETIFIKEDKKLSYPYPVLNSKFNNFLTVISENKEKQNCFKLEFFQKNNGKYYEKRLISSYDTDDFLNILKNFATEKLVLLEKLYRYHQIILPLEIFQSHIDFITEIWTTYLYDKHINKFTDKIYFYI